MSERRPNRPDECVGLNRRQFLAASGTGLLAAAIPGATQLAGATPSVIVEELAKAAPQVPTGKKKKIPIGVFDPVYADLSLDAMLDKVSTSENWPRVDQQVEPVIQGPPVVGVVFLFGVVDPTEPEGLQAGVIDVPPDGDHSQ